MVEILRMSWMVQQLLLGLGCRAFAESMHESVIRNLEAPHAPNPSSISPSSLCTPAVLSPPLPQLHF